MALELDRDRQRRVLGVVQELLGGSLGQRRERAEFVDKLVGRFLQFGIGHAFGDDAPFLGLFAGNPLRTHHDVLGAGDADHLLQPCGTARARNLSELLLRQRIECGLRRDPKVAGQRQFEPDAEAIAAIGGYHRLGAARRRGDIPGQLRHVLGRGFHKTSDIAAAGEMLADRSHHNDPDPRILVEGFEHQPKLIALRHRYDVVGRPVENDIGTFVGFVDFHLKAVEL